MTKCTASPYSNLPYTIQSFTTTRPTLNHISFQETFYMTTLRIFGKWLTLSLCFFEINVRSGAHQSYPRLLMTRLGVAEAASHPFVEIAIISTVLWKKTHSLQSQLNRYNFAKGISLFPSNSSKYSFWTVILLLSRVSFTGGPTKLTLFLL